MTLNLLSIVSQAYREVWEAQTFGNIQFDQFWRTNGREWSSREKDGGEQVVLPTLDRETALTWVIGDCCVFVTKVVSLVSVKTETPAIYQHNGIHGVALWKGEGGAFVVADSSAKEAFEVTEGGEWTKQGQEERVWSVRDSLLLEGKHAYHGVEEGTMLQKTSRHQWAAKKAVLLLRRWSDANLGEFYFNVFFDPRNGTLSWSALGGW